MRSSATRPHKGELFRITGLCIRAERETQKLTQRHVAQRTGMTPVAYSYMEKGYSRIHMDTLLKVCDALDKDPTDVLRVILRLKGLSEGGMEKKANE